VPATDRSVTVAGAWLPDAQAQSTFVSPRMTGIPAAWGRGHRRREETLRLGCARAELAAFGFAVATSGARISCSRAGGRASSTRKTNVL